jgi:hypothetical protein
MEEHHDDGSSALSRCIGHPLVSLHHALRSPRAAPWRRPSKRKEWIERQLQELSEIFAVAVSGFSVLHNHLS